MREDLPHGRVVSRSLKSTVFHSHDGEWEVRLLVCLELQEALQTHQQYVQSIACTCKNLLHVAGVADIKRRLSNNPCRHLKAEGKAASRTRYNLI